MSSEIYDERGVYLECSPSGRRGNGRSAWIATTGFRPTMKTFDKIVIQRAIVDYAFETVAAGVDSRKSVKERKRRRV